MQRKEAAKIGQRLIWAREAHGMRQEDLATAVGTERSMIGRIERGERVPSIFLAMSLMHVLKVSPQYLLWGSLEGVEPTIGAILDGQHPELQRYVPPWRLERPFPGKSGRAQRGTDPVQRRNPKIHQQRA